MEIQRFHNSQQLKHWLDLFIRKNDSGTYLPSDKELSDACGLSVSTISRLMIDYKKQKGS